MKIECILRRNPPTTVILGSLAGDKHYKFQPDELGRHVCEVEDAQHIARLLSISEAYRLPGDEPIPQALIPAIVEHSLPTAAATLAPIDESIIKGSNVHPATFDLGGTEPAAIEDVVFHALTLSGLTTPEWNSLPDEDRHNFIDIALDDLDERDLSDEEDKPEPMAHEAKPTPETAPVSAAGSSSGAVPSSDQAATAAELEGLRADYLAKFGKKPHYKVGADKLRTLIAADAPPDNEE
jgi:hypothetical protein